MGIHSYTQPSSSTDSDSSGIRRRLARHVVPINEYGILTQCYCGARAILDTCRSTMDPGRRFFTCPNVGDGNCHIWKWLNEGILEELTTIKNDYETVLDKLELFTYIDDFYIAKAEIDQLKQDKIQTDDKIAMLAKTVDDLKKNKTGITSCSRMHMAITAVVLVIALTIMMFK
ncbi:unnamed protein product [Thlaspi arvense]|uniref:GRF-type domain-containing protein n=1 Tax=Thlaspi arvense TaxID=13288 RepID=A0AAU9RB32_THLAR|nr:unnamed protein product [Thlaspi arvense]